METYTVKITLKSGNEIEDASEIRINNVEEFFSTDKMFTVRQISGVVYYIPIDMISWVCVNPEADKESELG